MFRKRKKRGFGKQKKRKDIINEIEVEKEVVEGPWPVQKKKKKKKKKFEDEEDDTIFSLRKRDESRKKKKKKKKRQRDEVVDITEERQLPEQEAPPSYSQVELKRLSGLAQPVAFEKTEKTEPVDATGMLDGIFPSLSDDEEGEEYTPEQIEAAKARRRRVLARGNGVFVPGRTEVVFLADAIKSVKRKIDAKARSGEYNSELPEPKRRKSSSPSGEFQSKTGRYSSSGWNLVEDLRNVPSPAAIRWNVFDALGSAQGHGEQSTNSLVQTKLEISEFENEIKKLDGLKDAENKQFIFFQELQEMALAYTGCCEDKIPMIRNALKEFRELRQKHREELNSKQVERCMEYFTVMRKMENGIAELADATAEKDYQRERLGFLEDVNTIFANAQEEYQSFVALLQFVQRWKQDYEKIYFAAFVPESIPKIVAPFVRIALASYNPHQMTFPDHDWYTELFQFPIKEDDPKWSKPDPDVNMIPTLVATFVVPVLVDWIQLDWNCYSRDETTSLAKEVDIVLQHLEDHSKLMSSQAMLLEAVFARMKRATELHCEEVPLVPEFDLSSDQGKFCVFRWNQALELLRGAHLFREMVNPKVVKDQATKVMSSCLLPFHAHLSMWPHTRKVVSGELIQRFSYQTEQLLKFAKDFDIHKDTISAHCYTFINNSQKQDPETCRLFRNVMEKIHVMRDEMSSKS